MHSQSKLFCFFKGDDHIKLVYMYFSGIATLRRWMEFEKTLLDPTEFAEAVAKDNSNQVHICRQTLLKRILKILF